MGSVHGQGGDIIRLGKSLLSLTGTMARTLPAGIARVQIQDQLKAVYRSVGEFAQVPIEAVVIVLAVSFINLGLYKRAAAGTKQLPFWRRYTPDILPGLVVGITISLVLANAGSASVPRSAFSRQALWGWAASSSSSSWTPAARRSWSTSGPRKARRLRLTRRWPNVLSGA